jgi:TetR/AcrR family transcriptional repressor of nem operon
VPRSGITEIFGKPSVMKQDTKARLLEVGGEIAHHKGYNSTGIQEVLKAAGVPKGSFYFYFKNKEDFGLQLIDHYTDLICDKVDEYLGDQGVPPIQRLRNSFKWFVAIFEQNDFKGG